MARRTHLLGLLVLAACDRPTVLDSDPPVAVLPAADFENPRDCVECHPMQMGEWQGSVMHYAAASPVFNAFELTVQKLTEGGFAPNGTDPNFCTGCHSPTGVYNDEIADYVDADSAVPMRTSLSDTSMDGLHCDFCHTVTGPDLDRSPLGDGIANLALTFEPNHLKQGPISDPIESEYHASVGNGYLQSAEFCGSCHDVRLPSPDVVTGEPFQRLENLFTEWQTGPWNTNDNPVGEPVTCQDCHMSLYPLEAPGTYPMRAVSVKTPDTLRPHALHAFTAVSIPLVDDPRFPNVDTDAVDQFGFPLGQEQRRQQMLASAVTLEWAEHPRVTDEHIRLRLDVTNTGAGHNVPAGFSQEREVWLEVTVQDDLGVLYRSGHLTDSEHPETGELEPDGLLHDEDLNDHHFEIELESFSTTYVSGPDRNQRPERNLGLINFQNHFVRVTPQGVHERVLNPLEANHMDNSHSLPPLVTVPVAYDVPLPPRPIAGPVRVDIRLRYRSFPPEFLRFLAQREPDLVDEDTVDRNTIVEMAQLQALVGP